MTITRITEDNRNYFSHLLPQHGLHRGDQLIGVICDEEAAAAAILEAAGRRAVLKWLYVDPEKRRRGLPINLVNAIMNLDKKETISFILCDILEQDELDALWSRIKGVQEEIKKLPGLVQDQETGRYQYTDKEDQDDRLRQLKIMKEGIRDAKKRGQIFGLFRSQIVNNNKLDVMIQKREQELQEGKK